MLLASFLFAAMGVCVKLAAELYTTSEIVMYRGMMGAAMLFVLSRLRGDSMRTPLPWAHLTRGVIGVTALWLWFYAIGRLPLAMSMTLNSMAPIWIAAILLGAAWWRGQAGWNGVARSRSWPASAASPCCCNRRCRPANGLPPVWRWCRA